jgi:hypothetical protein
MIPVYEKEKISHTVFNGFVKNKNHYVEVVLFFGIILSGKATPGVCS